MNQNPSITSLLLLLLNSLTCFSQASLHGKVIDGKTGEPVPYANVFFTSTTMGSSTAGDGTFVIKNIPTGKYDLAVSVIGYQRYQLPVEFQDTEVKINIVLKQEPVNLAEVTVVADQEDYKTYFPVFQKYFLGETSNSRQCVFANPGDIHLYYDSKDKVLTGHASKPIVIENRVLGYRLYYSLDLFELDKKTSQVTTTGIQRFEELPGTNRKDSISREARRLRSYQGSLTHFMRSLYHNSLSEEKFFVSITDRAHLYDNQINVGEYLRQGTLHAIVFAFKGVLKVEYHGEFPAREYTKMSLSGPQVSFIEFKKDAITIFENGYYVDQFSVYLDGYLAWAEVMGDKVPLSYYPPPTVNKKKKSK